MRAPHRGFTLFEIAIALGLVAVAITTVATVFPVGIRAQRLARFQLYAGTKVLEMMDHFVQHEHIYFSHQVEAEILGQSLFADQVPVDLDRMMMTSHMIGLLPLPNALARRIDSDGDEIQRLVDDGGRLFYATPRAYEGGAELLVQAATGSEPPTEAQTLLIGVLGMAQQNALPNHPCLAWPYQEWWPAPPQPWEDESWSLNSAAWPAYGEFRAVFDVVNATTFDPADPDPVVERARLERYLAAAQALVTAAGVVTTAHVGGPLPVAPGDAATLPVPYCAALDPWTVTPAEEDAFPRPWKILAMRYLAHAAIVRTGSRFAGDPATADQRDYARRACDVALQWAMRYAVANPYDWGAPRPFNRQVAFDAPLLQFDLHPAGTPYVLPDGYDQSWRVTAARLPRMFGRGRGERGYQGRFGDDHAHIANDTWGDPAHFNLTAPFTADERAREIVCWAVDWRAYEDFEEVPTGPLDASTSYLDSAGVVVLAERSKAPTDAHLYWLDEARNGLWIAPGKDGEPDAARIASVEYKRMQLGVFGADRNGNGVHDRGPLPATVRQRAVTVGRWLYYDRRLPGGIRN
ncbi:MAG TPA: hypothetical protein VEL07_01105 [Planctomycetota bacterium]|nr:hypothetical protein [Planctomycetota bacterium]